MGESANPGGPDSTKSAWPDDSGSDSSWGATGVFGQVKDAEPAPSGTPFSFAVDSPAKPQPAPVPSALTEPVVYKVGMGASGESSPEILDRMRHASEEKKPVPESPAPAYGGSSGGFTSLLRTLGDEPAPVVTPPAPAAAPAWTPVPKPLPEAPRPVQDSGFTSLLRTLGSDEKASPAPAAAPAWTPVAKPLPEAPRPAQDSGGFTSLLRTLGTEESTGGPSVASQPPVAPSYRPEPPKPAAQPSGTGGFTELLRITPDPTPSPSSQRPPDFHAAPSGFGEPAAPSQSSGGAFTQLFSALGSDGSGAAPASESKSSFSGGYSASSQPLQSEPYANRGGPAPNDFGYGRSPGGNASETPRASQEAFTPPPPPLDAPPAQGGKAGLTQLIRLLDEPVAQQPKPYVPPTQTLASSDPGSLTSQFSGMGVQSAAAPQAAPPVAPQYTPPPSAGPSEYSKIIDASRFREQAMRGGAAAGAPGAAAPPPQAPPPPPPAMPNYAMPGMPPPPQMPHYGAPPMQFGGGGAAAPPPPQFAYPQPPPMPVVAPPPPPPVPAATAPAAGKMQQFVPLLLILIIFLLLGVLVTVIFLLKH